MRPLSRAVAWLAPNVAVLCWVALARLQAQDSWGFEEEVAPVETWRQLVASQAADLVLFAAFAALALTSFFRKSVTLKYVTLAAAVAYLGIYKSQLLSIVNVFGVMGGNLPIFRYNLGWYLFALFAVVTTVLWGRLYCGRICAYGALTQLLDPIVPARFRYDVPPRIERYAAKIKYVLLAAVLIYFVATQRPAGVSLRGAVLDVHRPRDGRPVDRAGSASGGDSVREKSLLQISLSARRGPGAALEAHDLRHQAVVGVQHVQAVREDVSMGCDRWAEDHHDRVRPLRRLREAVYGSAEMPALDHHPSQGRGHGSPFGEDWSVRTCTTTPFPLRQARTFTTLLKATFPANRSYSFMAGPTPCSRSAGSRHSCRHSIVATSWISGVSATPNVRYVVMRSTTWLKMSSPFWMRPQSSARALSGTRSEASLRAASLPVIPSASIVWC